jgi:hypothetical protein
MQRLLLVLSFFVAPALVVAENAAQDPNALGPGHPDWRGQTIQMSPLPPGADVGGLDPKSILQPLADEWRSYSGDLSG